MVGREDRVLLDSGKPLAFLIYLACSPRRSANRDHLLDLLWAHLDPDRARHALRQLVWELRQTLGPDSILTKGDELILQIPLAVDRDEFLSAIDKGTLEGAVESYRGEFLPDLRSPGGAEFEQWADLERQRLRAAFVRSAEALTRRWLSIGRTRESVALARRVCIAAPDSEAARRLLLEALAAAGDSLRLTLECDALDKYLRTEGREAEPATRALLARLRSSDSAPEGAPSRALVAELVGRGREFSAILLAWETARRGVSIHLQVGAPAGLGKTRLLADVKHRLRSLGATVIALRASPADRQVPFAFLAELAGALAALPGAAGVAPASLATLVSLNPSLSARFAVAPDTATGDEALHRRITALGELTTAVAEESPFALLLDDMHWLDSASRQGLRSILQRLPGRVLAVTASRHSGAGTVGELAGGQLSLSPLEPLQVKALIASLGAFPDEPWAGSLPNAVHQATDGSPLFVLETLQLALDQQRLRLDDGAWQCPDPEGLARQLTAGSALRHRLEELSREERWVLLLLSLAGTPIRNSELTHVAELAVSVVETQLTALEQRGLVQRVGEEWQPAHDEIAAVAVELAPSEARRAGHAGLGSMLAELGQGHRVTLLRAARHLLDGKRHDALPAVFVRYVSLVRAQGDERRLVALASEMLGEDPSTRECARLVRSLPPWTRLRYSSGRMAVAASLFFVLVTGGGSLALSHHPAPDAVLMVVSPVTTGIGDIRKVPIRTNDWQSQDPIPMESGTRIPLPMQVPGIRSLHPSPDAHSWLVVREMGDSTTDDIYLVDAKGDSTRLTNFYHDDVNPSWLPDMSGMVFSTTQWSPRGADSYKIAFMEFPSRRIRRLTTGRAVDFGAALSPDGTRVGFLRRYDDKPDEICWVGLDGAEPPVCTGVPGYDLTVVHDWVDDRHMLVTVDSNGAPILGSLELDTHKFAVIGPAFARLDISPDRRWLAFLAEQPGTVGQKWYIAPIANLESARELVFGSGAPINYGIVWQQVAPYDRYLDTLRLVDPPRNVRTDTPYQLQARGADPRGRQVPIAIPLRWSSSDSSVLMVGPDGILRPRGPGRATVTVSAGGWRTDSISINVEAAAHQTVLREDWSRGLVKHWIAYGDPRPDLAMGPQQIRGFRNGGDGSYGSGAYSRERWDARDGLGIEAQISVPITRSKFQAAQIELISGLDSAALGHWDHAEGGLPVAGPVCDVTYPATEGFVGRKRLAFGAGQTLRNISVDSALGSGGWFRLRLQLFPDGRCGVALNGEPLVRLNSSLPTDRPFAVNLGYSSYGTKVLIGPLEVWQGVRNDVDWGALERSSTNPEQPR